MVLASLQHILCCCSCCLWCAWNEYVKGQILVTRREHGPEKGENHAKNDYKHVISAIKETNIRFGGNGQDGIVTFKGQKLGSGGTTSLDC